MAVERAFLKLSDTEQKQTLTHILRQIEPPVRFELLRGLREWQTVMQQPIQAPQLTDEERDILHYITEGLTTKQMSAINGKNLRQIEWLKKRVQRKTHCDNSCQVAFWAGRHALSTKD